ncbi:MAG: aminotransferase class III-fold pyridoxal phosphate-dependent enzyme [Sphingomonadaceae bacterium]|nr:aminotransferase class III-fold pyridoxal phosphate-dependent enzyme [Sphingomonadaceae bacterium]
MGHVSASLAFLGAAAAAVATAKGNKRLALSRAKHKGITGHVRWGKRIAGLIPFYDYDAARFFRADGAPEDIAARREAGFARLSALYKTRFARSAALTAEVKPGLSDLQFTGAYRVPFQFSRIVREALPVGAFVESSDGVIVTDLDGNRFYDLTGSYGVNLLGYDFYKETIAAGAAKVAELGPVLGALHPIVADNVRRLKAISALDEVSFHMSGTEAVMQAVRLARYHTRRSHVVRFAGAYHGWWGDVQPGIGNPVPANRTYTLAEMSERTLHVLATRKNIACVLVNPLQAMHLNAAAPSDGTLVDSGRSAHFNRDGYAEWLRRLAEVCTANGIVLIFDEVFVGFRLAKGGAREYFDVQPDMITYGKTLGGGLPVGVVCGRADLMRRWRDDRPADICFARGTFKEHPYVMGAMDAFLTRIETPEIVALYEGLDNRWNGRAAALNAALAAAEVPVQVVNLSTIWTVCYTAPSRYNWLLQYYLRAEGLMLSWVGTGRIIFSLNYTDADFEEVMRRFVAAARAMQDDGWWWSDGTTTNTSIRRAILKEAVRKRLRR